MHISRLRLMVYGVAVLFGILTALPNLLPARTLAALPDVFPKKQVTLGLDLRADPTLCWRSMPADWSKNTCNV